MEIREITTYHEKSPVTGYSIWFVFETKYRKAHLIHVSTLKELILSEYEFVTSVGNCLWPFNNTKTSFNKDKFVRDFKDRLEFMIQHKKPFPIQSVAKIISELDEISEDEAHKFIKSLDQKSWDLCIPTSLRLDSTSREYALRKDVDLSSVRGRPLTIVEAFRESGPASIYKITELVTGKLKTKSKTSRVVTYFVHKLASQGILEIVA